MILISITITLSYLILISSFAIGFDKTPSYKLKKEAPKAKFSVLIPFRNEAENLVELLKSIEALNYPKHLFEIIFIDDDCEDNSVIIIEENSFNQTDIKIISNERVTHSPKKDAITTAIKRAKHDWIITTDADCILPKYWLNCFDEFIQKTDAVCITAPVIYHKTNHFLNQFQVLDMLSLQGATIGSFGINKPFLCNGANFGYKKSVFRELNGFDGNSNIASGDDVFLLEKIAKNYPKHLRYLKCEQAIVTTNSQPTWHTLFSQRIRWASKTSAYRSWFGKLTGLSVLLTNALTIVLILLVTIAMFNIKILLYILIIKFCIDFHLIYKSATFFNQRDVLKTYLLAFLVYPFFTIYVAFISFFKGYEWKERNFKK